MKTLLIVALVALICNDAFAQTPGQNTNEPVSSISELEKRIDIVRLEKEQLREELLVLRNNYDMLVNDLEEYKNQAQTDFSNLNASLEASGNALAKTTGNLDERINTMEQAKTEKVRDNQAILYTIYWIIIVLSIIGFSVWMLNKFKKQDQRLNADVENKLHDTRQSLESDMTLLSNEFKKMKVTLENLEKKVNVISNQKHVN